MQLPEKRANYFILKSSYLDDSFGDCVEHDPKLAPKQRKPGHGLTNSARIQPADQEDDLNPSQADSNGRKDIEYVKVFLEKYGEQSKNEYNELKPCL